VSTIVTVLAAALVLSLAGWWSLCHRRRRGRPRHPHSRRETVLGVFLGIAAGRLTSPPPHD
jgi:hypothetical protein